MRIWKDRRPQTVARRTYELKVRILELVLTFLDRLTIIATLLAIQGSSLWACGKAGAFKAEMW